MSAILGADVLQLHGATLGAEQLITQGCVTED